MNSLFLRSIMEFVNPSFLWALLALAIPVIIHLFHFRRFKKVYFSNVKFLQEIKEETSSRNKIKNLLVLLFRLLALAALVFAFAQPFIPQGNEVKRGNNAVSIFVDNSFSMAAEKDGVPLLDIAKEKGHQIVEAYTEEDRFQVLTHDFEGRHQRMVSKQDALTLLEEINISPSVNALSQVIKRQKQALFNKEENEISYILSDFQASINDISTTDSTLEINLLPLQSVQNANVSVDSVWLESPVPMINQNNQLIVRMTNHSQEDATGIRLSIKHEGQEKPEGIFDVPAGKSVIDTVNLLLLKAGWHKVEVTVTDFPVQFDDTYFTTLFVPENIDVLAINSATKSRYLTALFDGLSLYDLTNQSQNKVDYGAMKDYDLIIVNDLTNLSSGLSSELKNYIEKGGNVLLFPASSANIDSYNQFLNSLKANNLVAKVDQEKTVSQINTEEYIFQDVYQYINKNIKLPTTKVNYNLTQYQNREQEYLLKYRDGSDFIVKYKKGLGHLYLCTSPLSEESNDLVLNAEVFVPMLYKMAIASDRAQKISYTIGKDDIIETEGQDIAGDITYKVEGHENFIPGRTTLGQKTLLTINNQVSTSGYSDLTLQEKSIAQLAFNYDRTESDMKVSAITDLEVLAQSSNVFLFKDAIAKEITQSISDKDKGIVLWKWCIIFTLIFLAIETLLLRFLPN